MWLRPRYYRRSTQTQTPALTTLTPARTLTAYPAALPPLIPKQIRGREAGGHAFCVAVEWQRACVVTPLLFLATVFLSWGIFLPLCSVEALP